MAERVAIVRQTSSSRKNQVPASTQPLVAAATLATTEVDMNASDKKQVESDKKQVETAVELDGQQDSNSEAAPPVAGPAGPSAAQLRRAERRDNVRYWTKLVVQPVLFLALVVLLMISFGVAQRLGFLKVIQPNAEHATGDGKSVRYICPMMCTPPQDSPGRCPICAMDLVSATNSSSGATGSIEIDPAARRLANIQTVAVKAVAVTRTIKAIGELKYDEGTLKTIAAYVDGRLDKLYADFTGFEVERGGHLALVYSPQLYSGQVEFLLAKKRQETSRAATIKRVVESANELYQSSRQRLIELGMTKEQIKVLEASGKATSRFHLCSPISGTVIEKLAVEGEYVKEGQAIYKLADLSAVWLSLRVFPEDAATINYGQMVEAEIQSMPGSRFSGRVAFVDRSVDPQTRTVGVRVVIPNPHGKLRVGDYAKATVEVPINEVIAKGGIFDPDLADKWISPRHPHVVESKPGKCRVCGVALVPAASLGFTSNPTKQTTTLVVPRDAVLTAGDFSIVYVETKPGRFEPRRVVPGRGDGERLSILKGLKEGEQVAVRGNFLLDSQSQLAGNPSLIDPTKAKAHPIDEEQLKIDTALAKLSAVDRTRAKEQRICPVAESRLGAMGPPKKVEVSGKLVFICCEGCREPLLKEPHVYLAKLAKRRRQQKHTVPQMDLPKMQVPQIEGPKQIPSPDLPPIENPQLIQQTPDKDDAKPKKRIVQEDEREVLR